MASDDRYLNALPRDDERSHLGPRPTEPIEVITPEVAHEHRLRIEAQRAVAEDWLAEAIRTDLLERVGHGPRLRGTFLPVSAVAPWADQEGDELVFGLRMGEHAFEVAVRRL